MIQAFVCLLRIGAYILCMYTHIDIHSMGMPVHDTLTKRKARPREKERTRERESEREREREREREAESERERERERQIERERETERERERKRERERERRHSCVSRQAFLDIPGIVQRLHFFQGWG